MAGAAPLPPVQGDGELIIQLWQSPLAATLQDVQGLLIDAKPAFAELVGLTRDQLRGRDPLEFAPAADRARQQAQRDELARRLAAGDRVPPHERHLVDAQGCDRWFRATFHALRLQEGAPCVLALLHDTTADHAVPPQAEPSR